MNKNIRFIKTKVDTDNVFLILTKCDHCPNFKIDRFTKSIMCMKKSSHVSGFIDQGRTLKDKIEWTMVEGNVVVNGDETPIPEWCSLSKKMVDEINRQKITFKIGGYVYEFASIHNVGVDRFFSDGYTKLKFQSDQLDYNEYGKSYLQTLSKNKENFYNVVSNTKYNNNEVNTTKPLIQLPPYVPIVPKNICSCCGQDKSEVKRDINNGMCDECSTKEDESIKYKSYINNFRLKRKCDWSKEEFKVINNLI